MLAVAAAGTGGHVFPGLAVGEALVTAGVARSDVLFIGGSRLERDVYPEAGFPFLEVELRGLQRSLSPANLTLPGVVVRAMRRIEEELRSRAVAATLGMGGYVTVPTVLAARRRSIPAAVAEQNAEAGLANRFASRFAARVFGSFPRTAGLPGADWVGNPIRRSLAEFDRARARRLGQERWSLDPGIPVLGVFGGSLGAGVLNAAMADLLATWRGPPVQVLHLAGRGAPEVEPVARVSPLRWVVLDFCHDMDHFYASCDLVVARAGGSVAELTATATPSILVPGGFGSGGHQRANAEALRRAGAARVVAEDELAGLPGLIALLLHDASARRSMAEACSALARPDAADAIAAALIEMAAS